jgi:2-dehydro-3-deoxyphosphogalactonate aldolase
MCGVVRGRFWGVKSAHYFLPTLSEGSIVELLTALKKCPLIAILRGVNPREVVAIGQALITNGFTCIEVPMNSPQEPLTSISLLLEAFKGQALIGAGTVTQVGQVHVVAQMGADLVVMPHTNPLLIHSCKEEGLYCIPGFSTPTEAFSALSAGADALKLFPTPPPGLLTAIKSILPLGTFILPVGGINLDSMAHYVRAGADGFGLGSSLYQPGDSPTIVAQKAKEFYDTFRGLS